MRLGSIVRWIVAAALILLGAFVSLCVSARYVDRMDEIFVILPLGAIIGFLVFAPGDAAIAARLRDKAGRWFSQFGVGHGICLGFLIVLFVLGFGFDRSLAYYDSATLCQEYAEGYAGAKADGKAIYFSSCYGGRLDTYSKRVADDLRRHLADRE